MEFNNFVDRFNAVGYNQSLVAAANNMLNFPAALAAVAAAASYHSPYTQNTGSFTNVLQQLPFNTTSTGTLPATQINNTTIANSTNRLATTANEPSPNSNVKDYYESDCDSYDGEQRGWLNFEILVQTQLLHTYFRIGR